MNRAQLIRSLVGRGFKLEEVYLSLRVKGFTPDQLKDEIIDIINDGQRIVELQYTLDGISLYIHDITIEDVKITIWHDEGVIYDIPIDAVCDILDILILEDKKVIKKMKQIKKIIKKIDKAKFL